MEKQKEAATYNWECFFCYVCYVFAGCGFLEEFSWQFMSLEQPSELKNQRGEGFVRNEALFRREW